MNNKTLLMVLVVMIGLAAFVGFKVLTLGSNASATGDVSSISLSTDPNPLRPGPATFMIDVRDQDGRPVDNAQVSFDLNMTTMNMGTQKGNATAQGNGRYAVTGSMSMRGPWRIRMTVMMPDGSVVNKNFTVNVP